MRGCLVVPLVLIFANLSAVFAHGSSIVDLQFVGDGHTITFSLPDSAIVMDHPHGVTMGASAAATVDGLSGYTVSGVYYVPPPLGLPSVILYLPTSINRNEFLFYGPNVLTANVIPISDPTPEHPDDLLVTFVPGTYSLFRFGDPAHLYESAWFTLTITEENAAVPEPASLVLLGTGTLGLVGVIRRRIAR